MAVLQIAISAAKHYSDAGHAIINAGAGGAAGDDRIYLTCLHWLLRGGGEAATAREDYGVITSD